MHPQPTLFDKDTAMPEPTPPPAPSIWDSMDGGDFRRDDRGRPLIVPPGETEAVPYKRATAYISVAEDDYGIHQWKRHLTTDGALLHWSEDEEIAWHKADWHTKTAMAHEAFVRAGGEVKANNGTRMHALTELVDAGTPLPADVTDAERADLAAYTAAMTPFTIIHREVRTVCDELHVAGTPDGVLGAADGRHHIFDIKSGKVDARKCAMQMALYAHSSLYDVATGQRTPLDVDQTVGYVIHLPYGEGKARVLAVDLVAGWEGVQLCRDIHAWRARNGMAKQVGKATTGGNRLHDAIAIAPSTEALADLWRVSKADWTDAHTAAAKARTAALNADQAAA